MSETSGDETAQAIGEEEAVHLVEGLADALKEVNRPQDERRLIFAKGENYRHIRHAQILERWPILPESWARRIEQKRLSAVDRTPGPASFGR
ncbi:MAG: hypothetical protein OEW19_18075 [Acidobacteriota bacterium]|nr:hypothetical protein [Acidobacteriota bacterium]